MSVFTLKRSQKIPAPLGSVWDFISSPANLKRITPDYMGFEIVTPHLPAAMYPGILIAYDVKPMLGIKIRWVSEITHVEKPLYFVDQQRVGPYALWHHEHRLTPIEGGVLMEDTVHYRPPFGVLGDVANFLFIRKQLDEIFAYRVKAVEEIFGVFPK